MKNIVTTNWARISKKQAQARYKTNQDVFVLPCKMHPENVWQKPINMFCRDRSFDQIVNEFTYYNCDYERGYYPAFYITRKEYDARMEDSKNFIYQNFDF